jgi:hypothetical protein
MTKEELKALAKQHFNLVEAEKTSVVEENFATATLEDGTKVTNDKESEFAVGDKIFVEVDGEKKPAPEGDHITKSGITITLDADSVITGMKRPDEAGEGSEGLAEDMPVEEEMAKDEAMEEKEKMEDMPSLESILEVIGEVVEEKMAKIEEKMEMIKDEVKMMKDKMSAFANEPAEESVVSSNFSKAKKSEVAPLKDKRYFAMLEKINSIKK